jgi:hypothetical protein
LLFLTQSDATKSRAADPNASIGASGVPFSTPWLFVYDIAGTLLISSSELSSWDRESHPVLPESPVNRHSPLQSSSMLNQPAESSRLPLIHTMVCLSLLITSRHWLGVKISWFMAVFSSVSR